MKQNNSPPRRHLVADGAGLLTTLRYHASDATQDALVETDLPDVAPVASRIAIRFSAAPTAKQTDNRREVSPLEDVVHV